jgi:hypothetical protein
MVLLHYTARVPIYDFPRSNQKGKKKEFKNEIIALNSEIINFSAPQFFFIISL